MKPTIENMLIAVQNPEAYMNDFKIALAKELNVAIETLKVPKTFAGDAYGVESKAITGQSIIIFDKLANGAKQFPESEHMLFGFLRIYQGVNAVLEDTDWQAGVTNAELKNATIDIDLNGLTIYKDIPLNSFTFSAEQNDSGYLVLTNPSWWLAQTNLKITLKPAKAIATATFNVQFEISGSKYIA